jgi:hypothetical protein
VRAENGERERENAARKKKQKPGEVEKLNWDNGYMLLQRGGVVFD